MAPYKFDEYDSECLDFGNDKLIREYHHYVRLISGASTSAAISTAATPFTLGISVIGVALAGTVLGNACKKLTIVKKHIKKRIKEGRFDPNDRRLRKRDIIGPVAFSATLGTAGLLLGGTGTEVVALTGAELGLEAISESKSAVKVAVHAGLDGLAMTAEHVYADYSKKSEEERDKAE